MERALPDRLRDALTQPQPVIALRATSEAALTAGTTRDELLATLEGLRAEVRPADEDALLDVMDMVAGWSAPHVKL